MICLVTPNKVTKSIHNQLGLYVIIVDRCGNDPCVYGPFEGKQEAERYMKGFNSGNGVCMLCQLHTVGGK